MANRTGQPPRRKTDFNYGLKGWLFVLYCGVVWMCASGGWWNGTSQNTAAAVKAGQIGVSQADVLALNGYVGCATVVLLLVIGILYGRYKAHLMHTVVMIVGGVAVCFYGMASTIPVYFVSYLLVDVMANANSTLGLPQLCMQWFPTKKGSVMGWATAGNNLAALVTLTIFNFFISTWSIVAANIIFGVGTILLGLISWFCIPDDPRQAGFEPDNGDFTAEELEEYRRRMSGPEVWTPREAMRNKNFWLVSIAYGLLFMASAGFLQQMVPYQISMGVDAADAANMMKLLPVLAVPGAIVSGWIDQRIGSRRCGMMMGGFYAIAGLCAGFLPFNGVTNLIFILLFFWWNGANAKLPMSHAGSVFGPRDYPKIFAYIAPIVSLLRVAASFVLAAALNYFGGYRFAFKVLCVCSAAAFVMLMFSDNRVDKEHGQAPTAGYKN